MKNDPFSRVIPKMFGRPFDHKETFKTIVIVYKDGNRSEEVGITNPWAYMKEVLKNPKVKTTFIKR